MSNQDSGSEGGIYKSYRPDGFPAKASKSTDKSAPLEKRGMPERGEDQSYGAYYRSAPEKKTGENYNIPHAAQDAESNVAEYGSEAEDEGKDLGDKEGARKNTVTIRPKRLGEESGNVIIGLVRVKTKGSGEEK
jgi:hypothetical protein